MSPIASMPRRSGSSFSSAPQKNIRNRVIEKVTPCVYVESVDSARAIRMDDDRLGHPRFRPSRHRTCEGALNAHRSPPRVIPKPWADFNATLVRRCQLSPVLRLLDDGGNAHRYVRGASVLQRRRT